ncbi:Uncharacterised protein [Campylobacter jejuni]|nr:Uncharacterised protein [Campylobacter jejuni]
MTLFAVIMNSYACAKCAEREGIRRIKGKNVSRTAVGNAVSLIKPADINNIPADNSQ